ncbi:uncharacterized protein LOC142350344 [Convolutriloba macropyga]|uniref:uncharacterized protein LOC142350344 n=1 Tax=Convolutriloba macropyga TaxID=536237 RepID=UPI003F521F24
MAEIVAIASFGWTVAKIGYTIFDLISKFWSGDLELMDVVMALGNLIKRAISKFFDTSHDDALRNSYKELSVPYGSKDRNLINMKFRQLAKIHHPDHGGDNDKMQEIILAKETILASL